MTRTSQNHHISHNLRGNTPEQDYSQQTKIHDQKTPTQLPPHGIINRYHKEIGVLIEVLINIGEGEPDRNGEQETYT